MLVKVPLSVVPTVFKPKMAATEMRAAIRPYSMAVAPEFVGDDASDRSKLHLILLVKTHPPMHIQGRISR